MSEPRRLVLAEESGDGEAFFAFFRQHYPRLRAAGLGVRLERLASGRWALTVPPGSLEPARALIEATAGS